MKDDFEKFIEDMFKIDKHENFEFKTLYGFTFVFQKWILTYGENYSSSEIKPVGIIYEENGEYYLAPLDETIEIDAIIKEFVRICLK